MSAGKDTGAGNQPAAGESTPAILPFGPRRRRIKPAEVVELVAAALLRLPTELQAVDVVHGPRDKGPGGAVLLRLTTGQAFYIDVQEEER